MAVLVGRVTQGFGQAGQNLAPVAGLICRRTGLRVAHTGTLNVRLTQPYLFEAEAEISTDEYHGWERLKLQRCCLGGLRGVIVRPETHESGNGHGPAYLEILAEVHLRDALRLQENDEIQVTAGGRLTCWEGLGPV